MQQLRELANEVRRAIRRRGVPGWRMARRMWTPDDCWTSCRGSALLALFKRSGAEHASVTEPTTR
jgi:hypothetical protein